ncbi:hypothetical protein BT96DRAFT_1008611 [Gymnopus androsaceus JB14]|uniref:J domain-containing protein n=1 Tax=Gymnopus androsaceus JB14 TaxID=1447944 RepID=A0A6A4GEY9_9AGAR|nr:hypothetical protein BT96DRAFT_1008611 [Gymnopus androsaceus JB14]
MPLDPKTLLSCQNSRFSPSKCTSYCGQFTAPEDCALDAINTLTKCALCGCFAGSHIHPEAKPSSSESTSSKKPFPSSSATADTIFSSRPEVTASSTFTASPFRDHSKLRENRKDDSSETEKKERKEPLKTESKRRFDPSEEDRRERFDNITGRPTKKRKSKTGGATPVPKAVPPPKLVEFHVGLYGHTTLLDQGLAKKPTPSQWQSLYTDKRILKILLPENAQPSSICSAIETVFDSKLPPAVGIPRFSLINVVSPCPGKASILERVKEMGSMTVETLKMQVATLFARPRGILTKLMPNFFYIALSRGSPDLDPLPGGSDDGQVDPPVDPPVDAPVDAPVDTPAAPVDSPAEKDLGVEDKENVAPETDKDKPVNESPKNKTQDEQHRSPSPIILMSSEEPEELTFKFCSIDYRILIRMLTNMEGPADKFGLENCEWWTGPEERHLWLYSSFQDTKTSLVSWFRRLSEASSSIRYDVVFEQIAEIIIENILDHCTPLLALNATKASWDASEKAQFKLLFSLGPSGMDLILSCLQTLYDESEKAGRSFRQRIVKEYPDLYFRLKQLPTALLGLVRHFRETTLRREYDPKFGYAELKEKLDKDGHRLQKGFSASVFSFDLACIDLLGLSAFDIREHLIQAFGHITDSTRISPAALCGGVDGLHGFYSRLCEPILDWMDVKGKDYRKLYDMFGELCHALAERLDVLFSGPTSPSSSHHSNQYTPYSKAGSSKGKGKGKTSSGPPPTSASSPPPRASGSGSSSSGSRPSPPPHPSGSRPSASRPSPSSPSAFRPSPRPIKRTYGSRVEAAEGFARRVSTFSWENMVRQLLRDYPHPQLHRRLDITAVRRLPELAQFKKLCLVYHPDTNVTAGQEWIMITTILFQVINAAKEREL